MNLKYKTLEMQITNDGLLLAGKHSAELKPYVARDFKPYEIMTDDELIANAGSDLTVDTENYLNYFLIAFKHLKSKRVYYIEPPFNPRQLAWIMQSYRTIGFNSIKYDLPLIWLSYYHQDLQQLKEASNRLISGMYPTDFKREYNIDIIRTAHIDLIEVSPLRGSLKLYGARLHAERIQELPYDPYGALTPEQINVVRNYCFNDLDITELLFNNLTEQLKLRTDLSIEYHQDLMSKSDAQIAEAVITSELKRVTGKWPQKPKIDEIQNVEFKFIPPSNMFFQTEALNQVFQTICNATFTLDLNGRLFKPKEVDNLKIQIGNGLYRIGAGGLHSSEKCVAVKANDDHYLYDRDVASFYPAIVLQCKLFPKHLGEAFLTVYQGIVDRRLAAKKAGNIAISENLKVTINGTFGKTGSPYSVLYAPEMTIQITVGGQLYLLMLIEQLELNNIPIVSANTDGILVKCPKDKKDLYLHIVGMWEKITGFVTEETEYKAMYSRDVNSYLAVKLDNKVKGKNTFYDPWRSTNPKDLYWRFQKNPNAQICIEAVEKQITESWPIEETIKACQDICKFLVVRNVTGGAHKDNYYLGKTVRWYHARGELGVINYIKSNNKVPDSEGSRPCMDLPNTFPEDIDYQWYINRAKDMLYDMAYLERPRQISFF